jgi:hypothetical protein
MNNKFIQNQNKSKLTSLQKKSLSRKNLQKIILNDKSFNFALI